MHWDDEKNTRGILCKYTTHGGGVYPSNDEVDSVWWWLWLNSFNNQNLEGDSSCKDLSWEYEHLEEVEDEVQESLEVKHTPITNSYVPFQHSSSSYFLFELKPRKKCLYQHHHSKQSLVDFTCQTFPYLVKLRTFIIKTHMWWCMASTMGEFALW